MSKDDLGDRIKTRYESPECGRRFITGLPVIVRLDGKCFSRYTKNMDRPYDIRLVNTMKEVTRFLVEETNALLGYTQSDEITLVYHSDEEKSQIFYDGKIQKMVSVLSSMCTAKFNEVVHIEFKEKMPLAFFDCRAFNVPNKNEAANTVLWRELDASKNSVSMLARHYFSHKQLHGKTSKEMQEMLFQEKNINWNNQPDFFKRGTFFQRKKIFKELSEDERIKIPEKYRPEKEIMVERTVVEELDMPRFSSVKNRIEVIFNGESPIVETI